MVLQVVALMVRLSSMVNKIRLLAVTAEVSTTSVGLVPDRYPPVRLLLPNRTPLAKHRWRS